MALKVWNGMTGAGRKQPLKEARKESWTCTHGHTNPRYATRCLTLGCNQERDAKVAA